VKEVQFIEEQHESGAPLIEPLLDAGSMRLRPVSVTIGATVLGLFPLAARAGAVRGVRVGFEVGEVGCPASPARRSGELVPQPLAAE
jgi:multidrug efflux pump subunit AcrB